VATTPFASMTPPGRQPRSWARRRLTLILALALVALAAAACATAATTTAPTVAASPAGPSASGPSASTATSTASPSATPAPSATPRALEAATPRVEDPMSVLAWAFTPIFQALFLLLAGLYVLTGNIVVAIVALTLIIRFLTVRLSARQVVTQQRLQRLQPELRVLNKELQRRYKGDRQAIYQAQQQFYKERGVSPTSGCLPTVLQMGMLIPMYSVISIGLTNFDPSAMLSVFNTKLVPLACPAHFDAAHQVIKTLPCINTVVAGIDMGKPQVLFTLDLVVFPLGVSALAIVSAVLQFVQSRMMMPPPAEDDPSAQTSRSVMIIMPLFSLFYGGFLPAGLFVYWIVSSVFSIVQQFLIIGWGHMFPLLGWTPAFARDYTPRFPVTMPPPQDAGKSLAASRQQPEYRWASAASTVRPNTRRRAGRRGRRR
jgi:YidC/Oxa1 family membrane protein insertase